MKTLITLLVAILPFQNLLSQENSLLVCGPMLCDVNHREAIIWLGVSPDVTSVEIKCFKKGSVASAKSFSHQGTLGNDYNPIKVVCTNLEMGTEYSYEIYLNGKRQTFSFPLSFKTKQIWEYRMPPPDFSFIFGSCAYINDQPSDRPGTPYGRNPRIFDSIANNPSDFMIWDGDNVYTREGDFDSKSGIYYRYMHDRSIPELRKLLASRSHYATWDDHDYGPDDIGTAYELKDISLEAFKNFFGNPSYGEWNNPGVYTHFNWIDCDFYLLDARFYRSNEKMDSNSADKHYLGDVQLKWLEQSLLYSKASFKFVAVGSQVINPLNDFESFRHYKKEFDELLNFIKQYKITGIIFLSGDRHFSEIIKVQYDGMYPLYDITSSALTARPYSKFAESKEFKNPYRVVPFAVTDQNYIKVLVSGEKLFERKATVVCYTVENNIVWQYEIMQKDLEWAK